MTKIGWLYQSFHNRLEYRPSRVGGYIVWEKIKHALPLIFIKSVLDISEALVDEVMNSEGIGNGS